MQYAEAEHIKLNAGQKSELTIIRMHKMKISTIYVAIFILVLVMSCGEVPVNERGIISDSDSLPKQLEDSIKYTTELFKEEGALHSGNAALRPENLKHG